MPLLNYTTKVDVYTTLGAIQGQLVKHGAKKIMQDYDDLAAYLASLNIGSCHECGFAQGWRCNPDRSDYSDFEKCKEGRKRWLQQPAGEVGHG